MSDYYDAFASDNVAGSCPEVREMLEEAGLGSAPGYGNDRWCAEACDRIRVLFETDCDTYFVFNGTAANSLALASCCQSYHSVICHHLAHLETDECGAPEFFSNGSKLLLADGPEGRILPETVSALVRKRQDIHYPKPKVLSVTQSTELGTVYSVEQLTALGECAQEHHLHLHMDGARFANAVAATRVHPADLSWRAGVDVLCFGGTKQGMPAGEAVVFFDRELGREFAHRCKQAGQLASKMRYLAAPWCAMLQNDVWLKHAGHANACAARLSRELCKLPGVRPLAPTEANEVFVDMPQAMREGLRKKGWQFYSFIGVGGARFVCSWATRDDWIDQLIEDAGS